MLSIGQLAELAGVTVKTVRHYHRLNLLPEPARHSNGYRSYGASSLILLLKIRNLAEAGVPLSQIAQLLSSPSETRNSLLDELDQELAKKEQSLAKQREKIRLIRNSPLGNSEVAKFDHIWLKLINSGVSETALKDELDINLLISRFDSEQDLNDFLMDQMYADVLNPAPENEFVIEMYKEMEAVRELPADDPRVTVLIEKTLGYIKEKIPAWQSSILDATSVASPEMDQLFYDFRTQLPESHRKIISEVENLLSEILPDLKETKPKNA